MGCANIYLQSRTIQNNFINGHNKNKQESYQNKIKQQFSKAKEQMLAIQYSQTQRTRIKKVNLET